ncbi:MAG TPA: hypothetical protein V6C89_20875 [Drouetiella sp.]
MPLHSSSSTTSHSIFVPASGSLLAGNLAIPQNATGLVLFAHGSGSSRNSPRNKFVARQLNEMHLGTLLIDLLTEQEEVLDEETGVLRFDIPLLTDRLVEIIDWLVINPDTEGLILGIFGASTGAASAIGAAVRREKWINAVVSRGGRPDLAESYLQELAAPTLLIVGGHDSTVLSLNQKAFNTMNCVKNLSIIEGATHLFSEAGALEQVSLESGQWFNRYLK